MACLQTSLDLVKREQATTSGAIHADVPAVWLIFGVWEISRAKPKSVILSVLSYRLLLRIGSRIKTTYDNKTFRPIASLDRTTIYLSQQTVTWRSIALLIGTSYRTEISLRFATYRIEPYEKQKVQWRNSIQNQYTSIVSIRLCINRSLHPGQTDGMLLI